MEGVARQLAAIAQITGYVFSIRDAMALSNFVYRFFAEIPVCTKTICMWTVFFVPTRRGYATAADSPPGLCAPDAQGSGREPLHNKNR